MGDWALRHQGGRITTVGAPSATNRGTAIVGSATLNTKGAFVQLSAATPREFAGFFLTFQSEFAVSNVLLDLAIGAATEQVIIPNLMFTRSTISAGECIWVPVRIPSGSRVSARLQASSASFQGWLSIYGVPPSPTYPGAYGRCTDYGTALATSRGTLVDAGAVASTKGAWAQIVASTTQTIKNLLVMLGNAADTTRTQGYFLMDIGIGAAAAEEVILNDLAFVIDVAGDTPLPESMGPFPFDIPSGTRIAARMQSNNITAGDRTVDVALYGMD